MQPENQPRPVSVPPAVNVLLPLYPQRRPCDMGLGTRYRQRMPMLSVRTAVTQRLETDCKILTRNRLTDILGHPVSRSWPSSSHQHQMRRTTAMSTPGQDEKDSLSQNRRMEGVVKSDKYCNLTFKLKLSPFRTVL